MKLVVGLGNIGKEYENTRHNIGFDLLDSYLGSVRWKKNSYGFYYKENDTLFLKPALYMNLSGTAVTKFIKFYKINLEDILILYDDLDTECGTYKIKFDSSSGGHNGIKSIISSLNSQKFLKIKVGINNNKKVDAKKFVLSSFTKTEKEKIKEIERVIFDVIDDFRSGKDKEILMNKYN